MHQSTSCQLFLQPPFTGPQWPRWSCYTRPGNAISSITSLTVLVPKARGAGDPVREGKSIKTLSPHCHRPLAATKCPTTSLFPQLTTLPVRYAEHLSDFSEVSAVTSGSGVSFLPAHLSGPSITVRYLLISQLCNTSQHVEHQQVHARTRTSHHTTPHRLVK